MNTVDDFEIDDRLAAHLRRTLHTVAQTVDTPVDLDVAEPSTIGRLPRRHGRAFRRRLVLAGVAAAIAAGGLLTGLLFRPDDRPDWAAEAIAVAEAVPRVLVTRTGWEVTRADELGTDLGEMTFAGPDGQELSLSWGTGTSGGYEDRLDEWSHDARRLDDTTLAGHRAAVFRSGGPERPHFVALWQDGSYGLEVRGDFPDLEAFVDLAGTIEPVDVDTWLSAMPPTAVRPESRAAAVRQMLADIPLPVGFDAASLSTGPGSVRDRYQLGAEVTGRVACAWIRQWVDATRTGDTAAAHQAVEAMASSHDWDILVELEDQGGWSPSVWKYADAIATDGTVDGGLPDIPVADSYGEALGCDTR